MRMTRYALATGALLLSGCATAAMQHNGGPLDLVVATTTDVHGRLRAWDYYSNKADPARHGVAFPVTFRQGVGRSGRVGTSASSAAVQLSQ